VTPKWQERLASHQEFLSRKDEDQGEWQRHCTQGYRGTCGIKILLNVQWAWSSPFLNLSPSCAYTTWPCHMIQSVGAQVVIFFQSLAWLYFYIRNWINSGFIQYPKHQILWAFTHCFKTTQSRCSHSTGKIWSHP
jgi:hypothetical protein